MSTRKIIEMEEDKRKDVPIFCFSCLDCFDKLMCDMDSLLYYFVRIIICRKITLVLTFVDRCPSGLQHQDVKEDTKEE